MDLYVSEFISLNVNDTSKWVAVQLLTNTVLTAVGDVTAAFQAAIKSEIRIAKEGDEEDIRQGLQKGGSIEDRAQALNSDIQEVASIAVEKVHDGLQLLTYVVLSTSLKK